MDKKGARFLWTRNEHTVYVQERSTLSMDTKGACYLLTRMEHTMDKNGAHCLWTRMEASICIIMVNSGNKEQLYIH